MVGPSDANGVSNHTEASPAEILAPAPVLAFVAFAVGGGIHFFVPLAVLPSPLNFIGGGVLFVGGLGILATALREMRRVGKSPPHGDEPSELIRKGPFRYTRNPLYLGVTVVYLGVTSIFNSLWPLLPLVVLVGYFDRVAKREEEFLRAKFGDEFSEYQENVRRWF